MISFPLSILWLIPVRTCKIRMQGIHRFTDYLWSCLICHEFRRFLRNRDSRAIQKKKMLFIEYRNLSEISLSGSFGGTHCKFPLRSIRFVLCHDHNSFTVVVFARRLNVLLLVVASSFPLWVRCNAIRRSKARLLTIVAEKRLRRLGRSVPSRKIIRVPSAPLQDRKKTTFQRPVRFYSSQDRRRHGFGQGESQYTSKSEVILSSQGSP